MRDFYVYVIAFDAEVFGIFATREAAEESLKLQLASFQDMSPRE